MTPPQSKPLLTRDDLPLDAIAAICRRWGVVEMAVDRSQVRPPPNPFPYLPDDNPFRSVDLYLIVDFGPGEYHWGCKKHHMDVVEDLYNLLGCHVWIEDKGILIKHISEGTEWAKRELARRDIIYVAEGLSDAELEAQTRPTPLPEELPPASLQEICRQWNVAEVAVNHARMDADPDRLRETGSQFIVGLNPDGSAKSTKERIAGFADAMREFFGHRVHLSDQAALERAAHDGDKEAQKELESRGVIYSSE